MMNMTQMNTLRNVSHPIFSALFPLRFCITASKSRQCFHKTRFICARRGVQLACAAYVAVFVVTYVPSRILNVDQRLALLSALTSMMLATSLVTSCMQSAFDFIRDVWHVVPWSILLFIGATQVSSKLLQVYDIPHGVFKLMSTSFWEERTAVEAQAMLAIASSVMAEAADKQVLVQVMAPVVVNILLLGLLAKAIVVTMVIVMVNVADKSGLIGDHATPELSRLFRYPRSSSATSS
ncbi:hypothetical protein MTO96_044476 [Rhipicephalus appendiculatus]